MRLMRAWCAATLAIVALGMSACSTSRRASGPPVSADANTPSKTMLALGGSATEGDGLADRLRDAWPYRVFGAQPRSTVFVNGALDNATVAQALTTQVPLARELKPDIVEVWLGVDDVRAETPIPAFTRMLSLLLDEVRAAGAQRLLVADLPAAYGAATAPYNDAIHRVARDADAELVALAGAQISLVPVAGVTRQPDAASHRVIADAFATAIRARP
jgi:lysophospholipase L1-like esterase